MRRAAVGLRRGTRGAASARPRVAVREARGLPRGSGVRDAPGLLPPQSPTGSVTPETTKALLNCRRDNLHTPGTRYLEVLGTGPVGMDCGRRLAAARSSSGEPVLDVTLVDAKPFLEFTPGLPRVLIQSSSHASALRYLPEYGAWARCRKYRC